MPLTPFCVRVETADDLEFYVNTTLATLLSDRIFGIEIDQSKPAPYYTKNIFCAFSYTTGAPVIPTPFVLKTFTANTEAEVLDLLNQYIAANPAYFFSEVIFFYRPLTPDPNLGVSAAIFYNVTAAAGANWGGGASSTPGGVAGGDLYGNYPNPNVGGLRGTPISATPPASGQALTYDSASNQYVPYSDQYFISGAAAQASAPHINGTFIIIYPGSPSSEAGTWQVTANQGAAFPADYTKVSDATNTASEVGIVDVGNYYTSTNVEGALQEIGSGLIAGTTVPLIIGVTPVDALPIATCLGVVWQVLLTNGTLRFTESISADHDNTNVNISEYGGVPGPGLGVLPVTFDAAIAFGILTLNATSIAAGWSCTIRRMAVLS
jgi:hypothetical protein